MCIFAFSQQEKKKGHKIINTKFRMLSSYRKLKEDMPLSAAKIEDECFLSKELYGVKGRYAAFGGEDRGRMLSFLRS